MLVLLLPGCFVALFGIVLLNAPHMSWKRALLSTSLMWGGLLTAITEVLSLFHALTFLGVLVAWGLALVGILVGGYFLLRHAASQGGGLLPTLSEKQQGAFVAHQPFLLPLPLRMAFVTVLVAAVIVAVIGFISPPNNWDSMTFHMARVAYWIQHASIEPFPTDIIRQMYEAPWAEFSITNIYLLSGGDRLVALVQWWSMFASLIGVSLIAEQLGADRRGQIFALVFAGTLPMGILQASSTQTDYVVTFWLVCLVHFLLAFRTAPTVWNSIGIGASVGLAMLTKATAYVYALPLLLLFVIWGWYALRWRLWESAVVVGVIPIAINIGYFLRNIYAFGSLFGSLFGPPEEVALYRNAQFTPTTLFVNVVRDLALQMGTPFGRVNTVLDQGLRALFAHLGLNINDPGTSWQPFQFNALSYSEDTAGNPLHFLIVVGVVALCFAVPHLRRNRLVVSYVAALIGIFLLFALYLKWQPWHSRLELVLFVLFAPVCGVVIAKLSPRIALNALAMVLTLAALPWVLENQTRPLVGQRSILTTPRATQYFSAHGAFQVPYQGATQYLLTQGCTSIGLVDNVDDWEYPLWRFLNYGAHAATIEHIFVANETDALSTGERYTTFHPCAVVVIRQDRGPSFTYHGSTYHVAWTSAETTPIITIYTP